MAHFNWLGIYGDVCRWCAAGCKCQLVNPPATRKKRQECQPRLYNRAAWLQEFLQGNKVLVYIYGLFSKGRNWELKETVIQVMSDPVETTFCCSKSEQNVLASA